MPAQSQYAELGRTLPRRLQTFFVRYPPPRALPATRPALVPSKKRPKSATATAAASTDAAPPALPPAATAAPRAPPPVFNPFEAYKSPITGRWHDPKYSLRRQAELVKLARENGVEELLPFTVKGTEERLRRRQELGLRVRGTGVGQKVKGKKWERGLEDKLEKRRQAMLNMPQMIKNWKVRGHGRGWKRFPK
ncbi:MAG: hypothetical protein M1826_001679 [Phylliscum demangeonii]|nr:MAG: hypothetical protein M1826_001679 [Phylliscum demangeonii]